jgi:uncharacterized protein DUF4038
MTRRRETAESVGDREERPGAKPILASRRCILRVVVLAGLVVAAGLLAYGRRASSASPPSVRLARPARLVPTRPPAYPLKVGPTGRYLVDRNGRPFMIVGDSPQALIANVSETQADRYFADRQAAGFNSVWINLLCNDYTGGRPDGTTAESRLLRACRRHDPPRG